MCGIAGIIRLKPGYPPERDALDHMTGVMTHRGPDEFGLYRDQHAGLAHARLSIVDLSTGQQPLSNEDGTLWIVFNGEIFNYVELREELVAKGHRFRTRSDTEVIVHAYEEWGTNAFERMNGQWAVALWDREKRKLVLSRDRLGVRPLYFCEHDGSLYFASEIKSIFAANASIPRQLDPHGIDETFTFWSVVPPQSVFRGITELRPATVRTYEAGHIHEVAYWQPGYAAKSGDTRAFRGTIDDAVREVRSALEEAVALRMLRADVPVGSYLSGGLDSSLIAALGRKYAAGDFKTFSLRFADSEYDETEYQRLMVNFLGSDHNEIVVQRSDIARVFPEVIYFSERPVLRTAPAPLFLLSKLVREHGIKVVLTGEGADEMFAGYDLFREGKVRRFWAQQPNSQWRASLLERLYPYLTRSPVSQQSIARQFFGRDLSMAQQPGFAHAPRWNSTAALKRLFSTEWRAQLLERDSVAVLLANLPAEFAQWPSLSQDQYIEIRTLLTGYLLASQGDRMLMAHSVEGRFPFLDKNVVALAESLPPKYKLRVLDEKHILKRAARGLIPEPILTRKKQPYRAPDALSFVGDNVPEYVSELLDPVQVRNAGIFDPAGVQQLWMKCQKQCSTGQFSNADNMALVGVLSTQLLHDQFIRNQPVARRQPRFTNVIDLIAADRPHMI